MPAQASSSSKPNPKTESKTPVGRGSVPPPRPGSGSRSGDEEDQQAARTQAPTGVQPVEPEDAYLTGVSRSLQRRLLGLNVEGKQGQAQPHPEADAPGLHATGSFAKTKSVPAKKPKGRGK